MEEKNIMFLREEVERGVGTTLIYPYPSLSTLQSHIHPKFAIFSAGMKMRALGLKDGPDEIRKLCDEYPCLSKIIKLHAVWEGDVPHKAGKDKSYVDPNDERVPRDSSESDNHEDGDYRSYQTKSGRGDGFHLRPKTRSVTAAEIRGGRTRKGKGKGKAHTVRKRKVLSESSSHNQRLLSEATLSRFNQQFREPYGWTDDRIRHWSRGKTFSKKRRKFTSSISVL
jgi:hypothetical protein